MSILIDLIGSTIVAGYVIFLALRVNMNMGSTASASTTNVTIQEAIVNTAAIIESDFKKIGYDVVDARDAIAIADSNKIRFRADMTRDGVIDSVEWYVGSPLAKYTDRQVRVLYRKFNNQATIAAIGVTIFKLKYLDQDGVQTNVTSKIAMIETTLALSSLYKVSDQVNPDSVGYVTTIWREGRLSTRNIKRHG